MWFLGPCILAGAALSGIVDRRSVVGFAVFGLLYWIYLVGFAKRLQDFGLPGLPIAALVVVGLWLDLEAGLDFPAWLETYLYALFTIGVLFAGLTTGESGANRYGPDPLASEPAPASAAGDPGVPDGPTRTV